MALQNEDVFNVSSLKYLTYDFNFLMDQSTGHRNMAEGTLNVTLISTN